MLTVELLGPLHVAVDHRQVEIRARALRTLMVVLALEAGSPVPVDRLASVLWGPDLPEHPRRAVQTHLTRLRGLLGARHLITEPAGYRLCVARDQVDAQRFVSLLDAAARASEVAAERAELTAALELWRGDPFEDVRSEWLAELRGALVERYLAAVERVVDLDLAEGRYSEIILRLQGLVGLHPLRESLWVRLLTALDRSGRQAEALAHYEFIRLRLAQDLGVDPGAELRQVYSVLLAGGSQRPGTPRPDPQRPDAQRTRDHRRDAPVPRQLPADIAGFTGRSAALDALDRLVDDPDRSASRAMMISSITGMAGVGKSALAVHWAHRAADRFPDGQLYVNLRGFDPSEHVMAPAQAVRSFLEALGVPAADIPTDPDAQVALYRTLLADRRVLVLLDNARDSEQVRPLIPGGSTCLVLVTSRRRLTGLVATEAARPLILHPLSADEARDLLAARLGVGRVVAEPEATEAVVARCAGLPLALVLAAARVATHPMSLARAAAQLDEHSTLDILQVGDATIDIRAVFSWSYRALRPPAARLFRLLGLHPGPHVGICAAASIVGAPVRQVRRLLSHLSDAYLVTQPVPGRYVMHDLVRAYATELAVIHDGGGHAGLRRLLDHYVQTASAAALLLNPHRDRITLPPAAPGVTTETFTDVEDALEWFTREHQVLVAAVHTAAATGFDAHTWQLAWTLNDFLYKQGHWRDRITIHRAALLAAQRLADGAAQTGAHLGLAGAYLRLGADAEADTHLHAALRLSRERGDGIAQARAHMAIAERMDRDARHDEAREHAVEAMALYRAAGHRSGQATALNMIGWSEVRLGNPELAITYCEQAVAIQQESADPEIASTWDTLGCAYQQLGSYVRAADCFRRAIDSSRTVGDRYYEAFVLGHLGDIHRAAGEFAAAREVWQAALDALTQFGHPDADNLRSKIGELAVGNEVECSVAGAAPVNR